MNQFRDTKSVNFWRGIHGPYLVPILIGLTLAFVAIVGVGLYAYRNLAVNLQKADAIQKQLESEFRQIKSPPNGRSLRYAATHKNQQAEVSSDYLSSLGYQEIRAFYDPELNRSGWKFVKEEPKKTWGQDYGGKQTFYCKGPYTATLEYAGQAQNQLGWTYSFALSWGLFDECS